VDNAPLLAEIKSLKLKVTEQDEEINSLKERLSKYEQGEQMDLKDDEDDE